MLALPPLPPMVCACDRPAVSSNGPAAKMPTVKARSGGRMSGLLVRAPIRRSVLMGSLHAHSLSTRAFSLLAQAVRPAEAVRVAKMLGLKLADDK